MSEYLKARRRPMFLERGKRTFSRDKTRLAIPVGLGVALYKLEKRNGAEYTYDHWRLARTDRQAERFLMGKRIGYGGMITVYLGDAKHGK